MKRTSGNGPCICRMKYGPPTKSAGKIFTRSAWARCGRDDLRRRRRAGKAGDVGRVAKADQIQLQRRRDDELGADADRPLRLLRRQHGAGTDVNALRRVNSLITSSAPGTLKVISTNLMPPSAAARPASSASSALFERTTATRRLACSSEISWVLSMLETLSDTEHSSSSRAQSPEIFRSRSLHFFAT